MPDPNPTMIVLRPGDKVLVTLVDDPDPEDANEYARVLRDSFPGTEFVIFGGVSGFVVQPPSVQKKPVRRRKASP